MHSVHCKDAKWAANPGQEWGQEVPLGEGDVGIENYLRTLQAIGYTGPLTIEREIPQEPAASESGNRPRHPAAERMESQDRLIRKKWDGLAIRPT